MADRLLNRCRILVVEDEYLLAYEVATELKDEGAIVLGPAPTARQALVLLEQDATPDGALLDVNLSGEMVFPVADALMERGVPLVFTTGYDAGALPPRFTQVPRCEKPLSIDRVIAMLHRAIHAHA